MPWDFLPNSECTFNLYRLQITDPHDTILQVEYKLNSSFQWIRGIPSYSATPNNLDFIVDNLQSFEVVFDKSVIDSKSDAYSYHGDYKVLIQGG